MKFFIHDPYAQNKVKPDLLKQVDGYALQYNFANFLTADGFSGIMMQKVKTDVLNIGEYGKLASVVIRFGAFCGTNFYRDYPYIELSEKDHEGNQQGSVAVKNKFPIFYNELYLAKVKSFLEWFAEGVAPVLSNIEHIKISGINQTTFEWRIPNQDFSATDDVNTAYVVGAKKWIDCGYTWDNVCSANAEIISYFHSYFPDTLKIASLIGGLQGGVTIDATTKICLPNQRPDFTQATINILKNYSGFGVQATALTDTSGTPANFVNSGLPVYYQLSNQQFGMVKPTAEKFEHAIMNGIGNQGQQIELYESNIRDYPEIIQKYRT